MFTVTLCLCGFSPCFCQFSPIQAFSRLISPSREKDKRREKAKSGEKRRELAKLGENRRELAKDPWISIGRNQAKSGKNWEKDFARSLSCFVFLPHKNQDKVEKDTFSNLFLPISVCLKFYIHMCFPESSKSCKVNENMYSCTYVCICRPLCTQ